MRAWCREAAQPVFLLRPMSSEHRVDARHALGDAAPREASLVVVRQLQSLHELTLVPSVLTFNGVWPYPYSASRRRAPLPDEEAMIYYDRSHTTHGSRAVTTRAADV